MAFEEDEKRADEETLPDTPLHAYGDGREEDIEGDVDKLESSDPERSQRDEVVGGRGVDRLPRAPEGVAGLALDPARGPALQRARAVGPAAPAQGCGPLRPRVPAERAVLLPQVRLELAAVLSAGVAGRAVDPAAVPESQRSARRRRTRRGAGRAAAARAAPASRRRAGGHRSRSGTRPRRHAEATRPEP